MDALAMGATDFLAAFTNQLGQHYAQANTDETRRQEQERESTMRVLQAAASSDSLNPEDYSVLLSQMLKLSGAKGKHIDAATQLMQGLFAPNTTYRGKKTVVTPGQGEDIKILGVPSVPLGGWMPGQHPVTPVSEILGGEGYGGISTSPAPPETMPPAPEMRVESVYTPRVRFMSPEEKAQQEANSALTKENTLYPAWLKKQEAENANRIALEEVKAKNKAIETDKKLKDKMSALTLKDQQAVTLRLRQRAQAFLSSGRAQTMEQATQLASELTLSEIESGMALKGAQTKVALANATAIPERVQQGWKRLEIEANRANGSSQAKQLYKSVQGMEDIRARAVAASKKADSLSQEYGEDYPDVVTARAQAESLRQQMRNRAQFISETYGDSVKVWGLDDEQAWPYVEVTDTGSSSVPEVPGASRKARVPQSSGSFKSKGDNSNVGTVSGYAEKKKKLGIQ